MALTNYCKVIELIKANYDKLNAEKISTKAGYEKISLYMRDILRQAGVPQDLQNEYLSRETIDKCIKEAGNSINQANENAERARLAAIKNEERINAAKSSILKFPSGKAKTSAFCLKAIEYYKFQIEACDAAISALNGESSKRHAMFNHESNTWAYHGGIASAIAGPAAGIMAAAQAKQRDDERNHLNAQLMAFNIQRTFEKKKEINKAKAKFQEHLKYWENALESTKFQLEENRDQNELLRALAPKVSQYTVSETGTVTLEIVYSQNHRCKIYGEKKAYIDGSIVVRFLKNGEVYGSTLCYLYFGGTDGSKKVVCINTELPALNKSQEKYDIEILQGNLSLVESLPGISNYYCSDSSFFEIINNWYYEKAKKEEEARISQQKRLAEKEFLKKKRKENFKKRWPLIATLSTVFVTSIVLLIVFFPNLKYNSAMKKYNSQAYAEAGKIFQSLGDFKDSYDMMIKSFTDGQCYRVLVNDLGITDIVVSEGATYIGYVDYDDRKKITSIVIPDSITEISKEEFKDWEKLESIVIPDSVTKIGDSAFEGCRSLTSVIIPDSVTEIGRDAFRGCYNLTELTIGKNVTTIGEYAFNFTSLKTITLPKSLTKCTGAFRYCDDLTYIAFEHGTTTIPAKMFYDTSIQNVVIEIPDTVISIGESAFCFSDIQNINIPNSVTSIGDHAFSYCDSLTTITIQGNVTSIGEYAFFACDNLTTVIIEDGVTNICSGAFSCCYSLTTITIPNSVTSIGSNAFNSCNSLTTITIPNSVTSIGKAAFMCCEFTTITIPNSVTSIGEDAFSGCDNLITVIFENPDNWTCKMYYSDFTISLSNLDNVSTAAKYLTQHYADYDWTRKS